MVSGKMIVSGGLGHWRLLETWLWDKDQLFLHHMAIKPVLGCSQAVPLVPLTEENEEAMENEQFQQLLRKLGVRPPASGQVNKNTSYSVSWGMLVLFQNTSPPPHCSCPLCPHFLSPLTNTPAADVLLVLLSPVSPSPTSIFHTAP